MPIKKKKIYNFVNKPYARLILIAVIVVIGALSYIIYKNVTNNLDIHPFTSSKYSFTIDFPGTPKTVNGNGIYKGKSYSGISYQSSIDNGKQIFRVDVDNFGDASLNTTNIDKAQKQVALLVEVETAIAPDLLYKSVKEKVSSVSQSLFQGLYSGQTQFTALNQGVRQTGYARGFFDGDTNTSYLFLISSLGASQTNFQNFENSFQFITKNTNINSQN